VDSLRAWPAAARLDDPVLMVEAARALSPVVRWSTGIELSPFCGV
jgi:hypothetical protein